MGLFLLPLVSVAVSLLSMQVSLKTNQMNRNQAQDETTARTNRTMMIMMPLMSLWIGFTVPAGLSIYWIAQYFFSIFQELICGKLLKKDYEAAQAPPLSASWRRRKRRSGARKRLVWSVSAVWRKRRRTGARRRPSRRTRMPAPASTRMTAASASVPMPAAVLTTPTASAG